MPKARYGDLRFCNGRSSFDQSRGIGPGLGMRHMPCRQGLCWCRVEGGPPSQHSDSNRIVPRFFWISATAHVNPSNLSKPLASFCTFSMKLIFPHLPPFFLFVPRVAASMGCHSQYAIAMECLVPTLYQLPNRLYSGSANANI